MKTMRTKIEQLFLKVLLFIALASGVCSAAPEAELIDFWNDSEAESTMQVRHETWQSLLNKYLDDQHPSGINRFAYASVSDADRERLNDYLDYMQDFDPRQLNLDEQKAFWINLYNAKTVSVVVNRVRSDDIDSIREIRSGFFTPGPWQKQNMQIAQQALSLDDIEHGILRPIFDDKRIHYVLNCASLGCPNLSKTAFSAANTEQQMVTAEAQFLAHPRAARIEDDRLILSKIFDWYGSDFASDREGLIEYIRPLVSSETAQGLTQNRGVDFEYDWALNQP